MGLPFRIYGGVKMPRNPALKELTENLHVSHSQIFTYLACSLKYKLQYVENRRYERIGSSLFLGSAIHTSIERYYKSLKNKGTIEPLNILTELLEDTVVQQRLSDHGTPPSGVVPSTAGTGSFIDGRYDLCMY